jgi:hypothetical protein
MADFTARHCHRILVEEGFSEGTIASSGKMDFEF